MGYRSAALSGLAFGALLVNAASKPVLWSDPGPVERLDLSSGPGGAALRPQPPFRFLREMAGGTNLFGQAGVHSPWLQWDKLQAADPDMLVILPCGYDIAKAREELAVLEMRPEWLSLRAVQNNHVYVTDGNQYFNRPGPRLAESLEILAEIMHPDCFCFGHEGSGWERL